MNTTQVTTHLTTHETRATNPARFAAFKQLADMSDRNLALFHWKEAKDLILEMEHDIRDYGDDADQSHEFYGHSAADIESAVPKIIEHLNHVMAIAAESAARFQTQIDAENAKALTLTAPKAD